METIHPIHKNCGGMIYYHAEKQAACCTNCNIELKEVEEMLNEISIMKSNDIDVLDISSVVVKESQ